MSLGESRFYIPRNQTYLSDYSFPCTPPSLLTPPNDIHIPPTGPLEALTGECIIFRSAVCSRSLDGNMLNTRADRLRIATETAAIV